MNDGRQQTLTADNVICTIPFSVLRDIEMPALSARKKELIKKHALRCGLARLPANEESLLGRKGLNGFAFTRGAIEIWQPTWSQPGPRGILMTYARPGEAERITKLKEKERIDSTLKQLDGIFSGLRENFETRCFKVLDGRRVVARRVGVRWLDDFFTASAPEGRIHFAGEHLSPWFSWIQGALSSGLRAVREIEQAATGIRS